MLTCFFPKLRKKITTGAIQRIPSHKTKQKKKGVGKKKARKTRRAKKREREKTQKARGREREGGEETDGENVTIAIF